MKAESEQRNSAFADGKSYDQKYVRLAPIRDALNLVTRIAFENTDPEASVLCVGAGTGTELLYLAEAFPRMRFTAVDPAPAMLKQCRLRAKEAGILDRCEFVEGTATHLPRAATYAAATAMLVSHFITEPDDRREFYRSIAERLIPEGLFVNATLAVTGDAEVADQQRNLWFQMQAFAGLSEGEVENMRKSVGHTLSVLSAHEIAAEITEAGFSEPVPVFQSLLMHGWCSHRSSSR